MSKMNNIGRPKFEPRSLKILLLLNFFKMFIDMKHFLNRNQQFYATTCKPNIQEETTKMPMSQIGDS